MLTFLVIGTAYSEPPPSKPFKVCPEIVTAKDTPCRVLGPTTAIVHRIEKPDVNKEDREKIKIVIDMLREMANSLEKDLESTKPVR